MSVNHTSNINWQSKFQGMEAPKSFQQQKIMQAAAQALALFAAASVATSAFIAINITATPAVVLGTTVLSLLITLVSSCYAYHLYHREYIHDPEYLRQVGRDAEAKIKKAPSWYEAKPIFEHCESIGAMTKDEVNRIYFDAEVEKLAPLAFIQKHGAPSLTDANKTKLKQAMLKHADKFENGCNQFLKSHAGVIRYLCISHAEVAAILVPKEIKRRENYSDFETANSIVLTSLNEACKTLVKPKYLQHCLDNNIVPSQADSNLLSAKDKIPLAYKLCKRIKDGSLNLADIKNFIPEDVRDAIAQEDSDVRSVAYQCLLHAIMKKSARLSYLTNQLLPWLQAFGFATETLIFCYQDEVVKLLEDETDFETFHDGYYPLLERIFQGGSESFEKQQATLRNKFYSMPYPKHFDSKFEAARQVMFGNIDSDDFKVNVRLTVIDDANKMELEDFWKKHDMVAMVKDKILDDETRELLIEKLCNVLSTFDSLESFVKHYGEAALDFINPERSPSLRTLLIDHWREHRFEEDSRPLHALVLQYNLTPKDVNELVTCYEKQHAEKDTTFYKAMSKQDSDLEAAKERTVKKAQTKREQNNQDLQESLGNYDGAIAKINERIEECGIIISNNENAVRAETQAIDELASQIKKERARICALNTSINEISAKNEEPLRQKITELQRKLKKASPILDTAIVTAKSKADAEIAKTVQAKKEALQSEKNQVAWNQEASLLSQEIRTLKQEIQKMEARLTNREKTLAELEKAKETDSLTTGAIAAAAALMPNSEYSRKQAECTAKITELGKLPKHLDAKRERLGKLQDEYDKAKNMASKPFTPSRDIDFDSVKRKYRPVLKQYDEEVKRVEAVNQQQNELKEAQIALDCLINRPRLIAEWKAQIEAIKNGIQQLQEGSRKHEDKIRQARECIADVEKKRQVEQGRIQHVEKNKAELIQKSNAANETVENEKNETLQKIADDDDNMRHYQQEIHKRDIEILYSKFQSDLDTVKYNDSCTFSFKKRKLHAEQIMANQERKAAEELAQQQEPPADQTAIDVLIPAERAKKNGYAPVL